MTTVLKGIRVLDVTRYVAGPICSAQLADLGAEVIHIENVGGGEDRTTLPVDPDYPAGAGFVQVNRNKKGLTLNLTSEQGQEILRKLIASSDMLVCNVPRRAAAGFGIDYGSLTKIRNDIIGVYITSFGNEGPYADRTGFDGIAQVMCGSTFLSGWPDQPMKNAAAWVDMSSGNHAAIGALAALLHRNATGEGQKIEVNLLQSAMTVVNYFLLEEHLTGMGRVGIGNRAPSGGPADLFPTSDGAIFLATLGDPMFHRFAKLIERDDLIDDPRFASDPLRAENGTALSDIVSEWTKKQTTKAALAVLADARIPAGPLLTPREILDDVHVKETEMLQILAIDGLDKPVPFVKPPYKMSAAPAEIKHGPPTPGEHNQLILQELGYTNEQINDLIAGQII